MGQESRDGRLSDDLRQCGMCIRLGHRAHYIVVKPISSQLFAGGPLPVEVGTKLAKQGVKLSSVYGATEMGVPNVFGVPTSHYTQDYTGRPEWLKFSTQFNLRLEPQEQIQMGAEKDTYELVILVSHGCFANGDFGEADEGMDCCPSDERT